MRTYGLKPHDQADVWEGTRIVERMAQEDETTAGVSSQTVESSRGDLGMSTSQSFSSWSPHCAHEQADYSVIDPHLSVAGKEIIKSFGGWTKFMHAYNLKEYNQVDVWEAKRIVERMLKDTEALPSASKTG